MTENAQFTEFLDDVLALALRDDAGEEAAHELVETADAENGWNGALIEAWRERWRPYAEERLFTGAVAFTAALKDKLA